MANVFDVERRDAFGIPILLERENAQKQIEIARHLADAPLARGPDLRRDILDELRRPVIERPAPDANMLLNGMREAAIEPREIDADDGVRLALNHEAQQFVKKSAELRIILNHLDQSDHR